MMSIIFAIVALFNVNSYTYIEYDNVRDSSYEYLNLKLTYQLCEQYNASNSMHIQQCQQHAYERAISIDA